MANYICTDFHGQWNLWEQIKNYCQPDDKIYFLGDAIDRGPDGINIMIDMLTDGRVIYLKGNHEDMMYKACAHTMGMERDDRAFYIWAINGNDQTEAAFNALSYAHQMWLLNHINRMPIKLEVINKYGQHILLSHAGSSKVNYKFSEFCHFKDNPYIWDREHLQKPIVEEDKNWFFIHGHTPVKYLSYITYGLISPENIHEPYIYADGHKIDLDLASFDTGLVALFDLDELKTVKIFRKENKED